STGHGFSGLSRRTLLAILGRRAEAIGVCLEVGREVADVRALLGADRVVAGDGLNSVVRQQLADWFRPTGDWRPDRYGQPAPGRWATRRTPPTFPWDRARSSPWRTRSPWHARSSARAGVTCPPRSMRTRPSGGRRWRACSARRK